MSRHGRPRRLLVAVSNQLALALANARLKELERDRVRSYAGLVTWAQEEERKRIARELHDEAAQNLVAIRRAVVGGELVDQAYVADLATLPMKDELVAMLAGNLVGKMAELAGLLQAVQRDFVGLIEARAKQLEEQGAA